MREAILFEIRMFRPRSTLPALILSLLISGIAGALEIREYLASRHDRFTAGASGPEISTTAYYNSSLYTAVGYATNPGDGRQFALVTPEHVLFARHFSSGGNIRFMNADGDVFDRAISSTIDVPNGVGGTSDLIIMKLSAPIGKAEKISPLPYLNLSNVGAYKNTTLTTFGQSQRAGRASFDDFFDLAPSGIEQTRTFRFRYITSLGNNDDAYAVGGDSGSPTFALANGRPALVGVHLAISQTPAAPASPTIRDTFDTFVPHYAGTVNGLLAADGYQLIPAYPKAVSLSSAATHAPLRQTFQGDISIALANADTNTATNIRMEIVFPAAALPTTLSGAGWIVENPSTGIYYLRRATLAGSASATVTASYAAVPVVTGIQVSVVHRSDGSPELGQVFDLPVQETFAGYASGLTLKGTLDDEDLDGFSNLIEYAFGGDPSANSPLGTDGQALAPAAISGGGNLSYTFPRRTDAATRGLSYEVVFSETLEENSWSTSAPQGYILNAEPYDPAIPGFEKVTASFPTSAPDRNFVRVSINLVE